MPSLGHSVRRYKQLSEATTGYSVITTEYAMPAAVQLDENETDGGITDNNYMS